VIPVGLASVSARIAELQERFAVPPMTADIAALANLGAGGLVGTAPQAVTARVGGLQHVTEAAPAPADGTLGPAPAAAPEYASAAGAAAVDTGPPGPWASRLPAAGQRWAGAIERAAGAAGIDPRLLAAVVQTESAFRPDARSHAGAIGLGQLMPATARSLGVDPHDPQQNLDGAARYLRAQLDRFGSTELALAAYNAGPGRVAQAGGIPRITETQQYVRKVTAAYQHLRSA
jgi:soluble lytic murein transglycosylase-like protein